tara:strand:+ start:305 stop:1060 length:756 start_codon:yes stop_codon:yes gene_type:complete
MAIGRKVSPARFLGAAVGVIGGISNIIGGNKAGRTARAQQAKARKEMQRQKAAYGAMDTSNIYANVQNQFSDMSTENFAEDLTVNQQQAQFEAEQGAQNRANIMQGMQGAAGGSGIASLAQAMANQGQMAARQASASIGQQESRNQQMKVAGAQDVQRRRELERQGEASAEGLRLGGAAAARGLEYQKQEGLMGLAAGELSATNEAVAAAKAQRAGGISQIIGGVASGLGSLGAAGDLGTGVKGFIDKYAK